MLTKLDNNGNPIWLYSWGPASGKKILIDSINNIFITGWFSSPADFGNYTLNLYDRSDIFVGKISATIGIAELSSNQNLFSIYPNPSNGFFTVKFKREIKKANLSIYNTLGEKIIFNELNNISSGFIKEIEIKVSNGIYFIFMDEGDKQCYQKLIIQ